MSMVDKLLDNADTLKDLKESILGEGILDFEKYLSDMEDSEIEEAVDDVLQAQKILFNAKAELTLIFDKLDKKFERTYFDKETATIRKNIDEAINKLKSYEKDLNKRLEGHSLEDELDPYYEW